MMLVEAEARAGDARREVHRHIGDFTLFWTGVYPEFLKRMEREGRSDHLLDYRQQGKRAYYIASTIENDANRNENEILEQPSHESSSVRMGWASCGENGNARNQARARIALARS